MGVDPEDPSLSVGGQSVGDTRPTRKLPTILACSAVGKDRS